jgi:glycine cleavage system H lipoate-binding protein
VDKFTFRVPKGLYYSDTGVWVKPEGSVARLGLSDLAQQRSGDMAFAQVKPVGTALKAGDEGASVETIKVVVIVPCSGIGKSYGTQHPGNQPSIWSFNQRIPSTSSQ